MYSYIAKQLIYSGSTYINNTWILVDVIALTCLYTHVLYVRSYIVNTLRFKKTLFLHAMRLCTCACIHTVMYNIVFVQAIHS